MYIGFLVAIVCVAICILFVMQNRKKKYLDERNSISDEKNVTASESSINIEETLKSQRQVEEAGNRVYSYINALMKQMCYRYRTNEWESFSTFEVSQSIHTNDIELIKGSLKEKEERLLNDLLCCISIEENKVLDKEGLKQVFYRMVLPFYPMYFYIFSNEVRYTAFLNRLTLNLFYQLSGKKFKVGYRNKYPNGAVAFTWDKDVYTVYDKEGHIVCKASFRDNKVYNGFGIEPMEYEDATWKLERVGVWKDGVFQKGELNYKYQKACQ